MQPTTVHWPAIAILVSAALLIGYLLGGFVAMVVLIVGGAAWWTVATFAIAGLIAVLACLWLWQRRSMWDG
ncbi:MAG: hypothetical protein AB7R89_11700 [Dehalococcoidia bacterium]